MTLSLTEFAKSIFAAPLAILLIVAGILFLLIAVVGNVRGMIEPGVQGRIIAGIVGFAFFALGLTLHLLEDGLPAPPPSGGPSPSTPLTASPQKKPQLPPSEQESQAISSEEKKPQTPSSDKELQTVPSKEKSQATSSEEETQTTSPEEKPQAASSGKESQKTFSDDSAEEKPQAAFPKEQPQATSSGERPQADSPEETPQVAPPEEQP
jgi:hypothetical protein